MFVAFLKQVQVIWVSERPMQLAAALTYYALFSLAPVIFITVTIAGIFVDNLALVERAFSQLELLFGPEVMQAIQNSLADSSINLPVSTERWPWISSVIAFLALLWAASGLFYQIHFALNTVMGGTASPKGVPQGFIRQRLLSFSMVIILGLLLVILSIVDIFLRWLGTKIEFPLNISLIISLAFFGLVTLCFSFMYRYIADVHFRWRYIWIGAGIAALLETIGVYLIGLLLQFGAFTSALAAAGTYTILLVVIYYMAQIFLLGAVITRVLSSMNVPQY